MVMPLFDTVRSFVQSPTETKVRQATDEDEISGATGTLMNEISVLTYSPKTLKEVIQVLKKRLTGYGRKSSHRNCIHILKTLTLTLYLVNNGSNEFNAWARSNYMVFDELESFDVQNEEDERLAQQIRSLSNDLCQLINDDELLEQRRKDVIQFRSSVSSPGRKSTDNSHLKRSGGLGSRNEINTLLMRNRNYAECKRVTSLPDSNEYNHLSNPLADYVGSTSLELVNSATSRRNTHDSSRLDPLEEDITDEGDSLYLASPVAKKILPTSLTSEFSSNNPFR